MLGDEFTFGTPEEKLKNYEAFNSTDMFSKAVDVDDFIASNRDQMESQIKGVHADNEQKKLKAALSKNQDLLALVNNIKPIEPVVTKQNPFPYLSKPMIDLSKYDSDDVAKKVIKDIDSQPISAEDKQYLKVLGARESDFRNVDRASSYKGMFQFDKNALNQVGIKMDDYKKDPRVQYEAALKYRDANVQALAPYQKYIGTIKDGVKVTKNGLGAMAHLLGASTVKDFFDGTTKTKLAQNGFKDGNGTHITEYLKMFS